PPAISEFQRRQRADRGSRRSSLVLARDDGCGVSVLTMRELIRQSVVSLVMALAVVVAVRAEESLKITPFISDNHVVVSFELDDAYNDSVREAIASGLRTTFTYELELRTFAWIDRTIGTTVVSTTDRYDNLTRRHTLTRTVDGRVEGVLVTEDDNVVK